MALGPVGSVLSFYGASVALGLSNSITLQSVYTCLSELISEDAARHDNHSNAGFYSSLFVASDKIAFALGGTLLAGALLSLSGFQAGSNTQTPGAALGIALIFALAPASFNALAILLMGLSRRVQTRSSSGVSPALSR
jgi:Na+/melibiose symporter-like transporter